jgi:hypothetical protein
MAGANFLARLIAHIAKVEGKKELSQYAPPSQGDILHDGLVGAGWTWGGILGSAAGVVGGEAVGGPLGGAAGGAALTPAGALAGGWAAHGTYREGQLIRDILSHPENWTVDAAGAIVPVTQDQSPASDANSPARAEPAPSGAARPATKAGLASSIPAPADPSSSVPASPPASPQMRPGRANGDQPSPGVITTGALPIPQLPPTPQNKPGGLLGMMIDAGYIDPNNRNPPPAGGLAGLIQDYLRNNPGAGRWSN